MGYLRSQLSRRNASRAYPTPRRRNAVQVFTPLVEKCKRLNRAMRIGTNHGSLSARILSYYGDTPRGMVESAFEFADICRDHNYHNFLFSMKASNPLVMVQVGSQELSFEVCSCVVTFASMWGKLLSCRKAQECCASGPCAQILPTCKSCCDFKLA